VTAVTIGAGTAGPGTATDGRLTEVADGVFAHVQAPGGWCLSNSGVITTPDGAVVVDTAATQRRAEALRDRVDAVAPGPRRTVVDTHHHGDHVFGNHVFGPDATLVGHELIGPEMTATGLALTGLWPDVEWGDVRVTVPTVTFADRLTLPAGDRTVELLHVGPAHTTNDVVVWLEDCRVLFAGDVVLPGCTPFVLMGSVTGSLAAVERLARLDPLVVVGGHGPVGGPEVFEPTTAYLTWVLDVAREGLAAGRSPLEAARAPLPAEFRGLLDPERLVGNLHRAYLELSGGRPGAPVDVAPVFGEMVTWNGGTVPTCWA